MPKVFEFNLIHSSLAASGISSSRVLLSNNASNAIFSEAEEVLTVIGITKRRPDSVSEIFPLAQNFS